MNMQVTPYHQKMGFKLSDTLIVLPALNEEETIGATLHEVFTRFPEATCLVVDDGSTDSTAECAAAAGAIVARLPFNLGVGGAMRFGFRYALKHGFVVVVQLDSDGQHNPAYIPQLLEALASADLVVGARFAGEGEYAVRGPRKWAMVVLSRVISKSAHTRLDDTTSGFRASGPRALDLFARNYPAEYLGDTVESMITAIRAGLVVRQVPVAMRPRAGGQPSQNAWKSTVFLARAFFALALAYIAPREQSKVNN